jgi:hypothetical protein
MAGRAKIRSVILCDDIRREDNGKEILIGVYNGVILFPKFPAVLRQLILRIEYDGVDKPKHRLRLALIDSQNQMIFEAEGEAEAAVPSDPSVFAVRLGALRFDQSTRLNVRFGIDGPARMVGWFEVRDVTKQNTLASQVANAASK